jgi:hypothetical protein
MVAYEAGHEIPAQIEHYEGLAEECDVPIWWNMEINHKDMPYTLNPHVVGWKFMRAYLKAKAQASNIVPMPVAA